MTLAPRRPLFALAAVAAAVIAVLALGPSPALAQESPLVGASEVGSAAGIGEGWDWLGLTLRLALVLVAIWAVIVAMRWYVRRTGGLGAVGGTGHLQILETRALGAQRSLQLVRLGDRAVLLGVTAERISPLLEIDDPAELEELTAEQPDGAQPRSLGSLFSGVGSSLASMREKTRREPSEDASAFASTLEDAAAAAQRPPISPAGLAAASAYGAQPGRGMRVADLQRALEEATSEDPTPEVSEPPRPVAQ